MKITYWSDYACPYCYIGEVRLHKAISEMGLTEEVELVPRAFELDPNASTEVQSDTATRFARKYGLSVPQAMAQIEHISALGREEGIDFRYAETKYTNTFNAHRLMKLALSKNDRELAEKTNQLLFDAYFTKSLKLADENTLLAVAKLAGLPEDEVREMLATDRFADEVRADEQEAHRRGIHGVPYFLFENGCVIGGATSVQGFKDALALARGNAGGSSPMAGEQCGPDGCKLP